MTRHSHPHTPSADNLSRRDFVATATLGAAAWSVAAATTTSADDKDKNTAPSKNFVDAHAHIWTRDVKSFPLAAGQTVDDLKPPSFTAEELLAVARPEGVSRVVLIQHHTYHSWDNAYLIDAAQRYPDTFRVVGMVDDTRPHPDVEMRRLLPLRVTGFRITSSIRGEKWLAGPGMSAMWKCAAETRQAMCCLINPADLAGVQQMCEHFPDTPVVIDHFARIGMDGQIREDELKQLCALAKHKHTHVKISAYYALGQKKPPYLDLLPMIRRLLDTFGPQRLMWASDSPYQIVDGHNYHDSIALIRDRLDFLTAGDKEWMLRKTAEKVFFS